MATKQGKVVKSAVTRERKRGIMREERHILWFLIAVILLLLYLLLAQHKGWWPYSPPKLGTAFYTNLSAQTPVSSSSEKSKSSDDSKKDSSGSNAGGSGSTNTGGGSTNTGNGSGSGTGSGNNNNGGNGGGSTPTTTNPLLNLAAGIDVGNTKANVSGQANGLNERCAVVVSAVAQTAGKQEVCTYSQGDKLITVTYLNDRVISASKSGF